MADLPSSPSPSDDSPWEAYAPHPYHSMDAKGEIITVNEAWLDTLAYDRSEVEGRWFGDLLPNISAEAFDSMFAEFKADGNISNLEYEITRGDGDTIFVSYDGTIEYDDNGEFVRTHCQFTDISERKQYETFIRNSSDIILLHEETGEAKYVSPAVERELGYHPDALTGSDPFRDVHPDDRDHVKESFGRLLSEPDNIITKIYRIRDVDGSYVWVESRARNLSGERGADGILINSRVIDERKQYEQNLERQNERLDEFASVVSHDLRNPLNVAQGRLELAREENGSEHIEIAARAVDRSLNLIDDMLELARAGERASERESVDVAQVAHTCWKNVQMRDATIVANLDVTVTADRGRFFQLMENLFRNAVEHAGDEVIVRVGELADGFYVEDDGPGIPETVREDVFEPGYSTNDGGTGFGLGIVKEIVEAHDWEIRVTESHDGGARFEITGVE